MLCVSVGAWAYGGQNGSNFDGASFHTENDIQYIDVTAGGLAKWAAASNADTEWGYFEESSKQTPSYTKLVVTGTLNADDIAVLGGTHFDKFTLVDMDGATISGEVTAEQVGAMDFNGAEYVSLPQGLDREKVKAFGETNKANTNFKSAYCAQKHYNKVTSSEDSDIDEFICYVNVGGSLRSCINATNTDAANFVAKAKYLTMIGTALPLDYASGNIYGSQEKTMTEDGHVSVTTAVSTTNVVFTGTGAKELYQFGDECTFKGADIVALDCRDMRISGPNMEADLTLPLLGYKSGVLKYVVLPIGDSNFQVLPSGCIGMINDLYSINVPSTVKVMKSGSLFGSAMLCHVWTDGDNSNKRYDNGAVTAVAADGTETKVYADDIVDQTPLYGTWTLPASLTHIETIITGAEHVKDLYVLGTTAPVCEVDAFGSRMYLANNGYTVPSDQKIISRDYYYSNTSGKPYTWTTMLHYPTETVAPELQRYTDPTREYTAATGLKDDKGNTIYLPTMNEWNRAYWQGTTGYVWKAWKTERDENYTIYIPGGSLPSFGYSKSLQSDANDAYEKKWHADSYLSSFYDVTDGGSLTKPSTLEDYYNVYWNESTYKLNNQRSGDQLYPQAETADATDGEGNTITAQRPVYVDGKIVYDPDPSGTYVKEYADGYYEDSENGTYVEETTESYVAQAGGDYVKVVTESYEKVGGQYDWDEYQYNHQSEYYVLIDGEYVQGAGGDTNWWQGDHYKKVTIETYREAEEGETGEYSKVEVGTGNYIDATDGDKVAGKTLYSYGPVWTGNYVAATSEQLADATVDKYSQKMETYTIQIVTNSNDYRGWHQFVLTSYSANDKAPTHYEKMYTSDTDWWTICLPYDLTKKEVMRFFSDGSSVPVVSKLMYVKRDEANQKITLCFTKNLMKNKEDFTGQAEGAKHGALDANGVLKVSIGTEPSDDDIIMHAGVGYLIKPTLPASASHTIAIPLHEVVSGQTLSDEDKADNDLYNKIKASAADETNWGDMVKNAIYTVPAFDMVEDGALTIGEKEEKCNKSTTFTYSMVGSLFRSPMPKDCYFLGWDSSKNKAAFWYNRVSAPNDWSWNNMTCIICPNFVSKDVTKAYELKVAAHWDLEGNMACDDLESVASGAKRMPAMLFDAAAPEGMEATGISEVKTTVTTDAKAVYTLNGVRVSDTTKGLAKGIYVVSGKKVVVK